MVTDKFDVTDIMDKGRYSPTNSPSKYSGNGKNSLNVLDIEHCQPKQLKQNTNTNIPDYMLDVRDITGPKATKFQTNRVSNPLSPTYELQTLSRRHKLVLDAPQGTKPRQLVPLKSRRLNQEQME